MKRLAFFPTFARSFYDLSVYREVAAVDGGNVFWYFCRLVAIASLIISIGWSSRLGAAINQVAESVGGADIPEVVIQHGQASATVKQPWVRKTDDGSVFIIDTTGQTAALPADARGGMLLTKDKLFIQQPGQLQVRPLSQFPDFTFNRAKVKSWLATIRTWAVPVVFVGNGIYQFCVKMIQSIFLAIVAIVVFSSRQLRLGFAAGWNIALVAMTPPLMAVALITLFGIRVPLLFVLYYAAYIAYVVLGAMQCENPPLPTPMNVPPPPIVPPMT